MSKKILICLLATVLLTTAPSTEAQQPGKIFRIGFLDGGTAAGSAVLVKAFLQELSRLGWIEGKISPSSTGLQRERMIVYLSLQRNWFVLRSI